MVNWRRQPQIRFDPNRAAKVKLRGSRRPVAKPSLRPTPESELLRRRVALLASKTRRRLIVRRLMDTFLPREGSAREEDVVDAYR
jgi:hypothetical protein